MSEEQLKAFLEKVKADTSLQEKLKAAADADAVAAIAKEAGFSISADDLKNAPEEISDEELENVAGGTLTLPSVLLSLCPACPGPCLLTAQTK
jgi:predicted ribosomally synthesized peptide with nif11-like leader